MKDMKQKMPVLIVNPIKSKLFNLTNLIYVNMEKVVILNMNLLNIEVLFVLFRLEIIVLSKVLIS